MLQDICDPVFKLKRLHSISFFAKKRYLCTLKNNRGRVPQINQKDYVSKN